MGVPIRHIAPWITFDVMLEHARDEIDPSLICEEHSLVVDDRVIPKPCLPELDEISGP